MSGKKACGMGGGRKMEITLNNLQQEIRELQLGMGCYKTDIPYITVCHFKDAQIQMPQTDNPYLYIVVDGHLRLHTPSGIMDYMAGQYSVSKIDTPLFGTVLAFSEKQDFLATVIEFTANDVITTILDIDNAILDKVMNGKMEEQDMAVSDKAVIQSVCRLFYYKKQTISSEFIGKNILREMIYYIVCGSCGKQFVQGIANTKRN